MRDKLDKEIAITIGYIQDVDELIEKLVDDLNTSYTHALSSLKALDQLGKIRDEYEDCLEVLINLRTDLDSKFIKD